MNAARPPAREPEGGGPDGFRFPRSHRICSGREIRELLKRGKRKRTAHLDVFFAASPVAVPRFGLVVPKHRRRIVDRNRLRRRLREVGRTELLPRLRQAGRSLDVVVRARPEAYGASYVALRDELVEWMEVVCAGS